MKELNTKRLGWGWLYFGLGLVMIYCNRNIFLMQFAYPATWWCLGWAAVGIGAGLINTSNHRNGPKEKHWHYVSYCLFALVFVTLVALWGGLTGSAKASLKDVGVKFYVLAALTGLGLGFLEDKLHDLLMWRFGKNAQSEVTVHNSPSTSARSNGLISGLVAAAITSTTLVVVNAWVVPTVARHQKRIDRMFQAMFDVGPLANLIEVRTWNIWYERQREDATNKPLEDLQQAQAQADSLASQLPVIFDDSVAEQWTHIVRGYWEVAYPITHPREYPKLMTEKEMNDKLNTLKQPVNELVGRMHTIVVEVEGKPWWEILLSDDR